MTPNLQEASAKLRSAVTAAARGFVDREPRVELVALSAVAREHLLVIGPPGTTKSVVVRRIAQATGGRYFEYLLGRQSLIAAAAVVATRIVAWSIGCAVHALLRRGI
jgi:MoxR-like ATPase